LKKLEKIAKIGGVVLGSILLIVLVVNISSSISQKIETNNFNQSREEGNQTLEEVRTKWQAASDSCQLGYQVGLEKINEDPNYDLGTGPSVDLYFRIEAEKFKTFWSSEQGKALDCFSDRIFNAKLSEKLILTDSQFNNRKDSWDSNTFDFYDGVEDDGTIFAQGVIGDEDDHLDGYLTYFDDYDEFHISLKWELDKEWFARVRGL
jgi:hypothetical protein